MFHTVRCREKHKLSHSIGDKKDYRNVKMLNLKKYSCNFLVSYSGILYNVYIGNFYHKRGILKYEKISFASISIIIFNLSNRLY